MPLGRYDTSRFRVLATSVLSIALTASPVLRADEPISPKPQALVDARNARADAEAEVPLLRMNFISTPWEKVLEHIAEETGSQLVVHDMPPGRYSRRDLTRYNRTQAVQIINQELEPLGFRVLEKDKFLTVIQIQRARVEYPRATYGPADDANAAGEIRGSRPAPNGSPAPFPGTGERVAQPVARPPQPTASQILLAGQETPAEDAGPQTVTVKTERPIIEVAQQLYAAFRERAELVQTGPDELPAFRVYRSSDPAAPDAEREVWFTVSMDTAAGEFHIEADEKVAASLVALIRTLDRPATPGETTRIVPDAENADEMARQLDEQLDRLENAQRRQPGAGDLPTDATVPPEMLGNLRGDVTVEALADLDLIIIRGNERDVEAVMAVIDIIEKMAIGASPGIQLFFLNNVDSESLAALLNDVYERLTNLSAGTAASARQTRAVAIVPVVRPNAILILAPQNSIESILDLAEQLDQPVTPGTEAEVFYLRSAIASQVATQLEQFYEERPGLGTQIRIVADVRTNSVIVNASPSELAEVSKLIRQMDRGPKAVAQVRVVPLENALADEMAEFLNSIIQGVINPAQTTGQQFAVQGTGGDQALRDSKSMVLEFLTTDGTAQRLIRSGLLTDVRITGDIRTNTLTVTAPQASMPLVLELIRTLDQPTTTVADIKVFPLQNADAEAAAELLLTLFPESEEGQPGVQIAGAEGFGSALVPLRVSVDPRTNTVIAVGSQEVLQIVEAVLFRIDAADARNRRTEVLRLRNSPANDVAIAINQFLQSQRDLLQIDPNRISTSELLEQEIIVTPEPISNNLIISATPRYFDTVLKLARELDREPAQVMIQALIVEVTLDDTDEFGVELGFQDPTLFDRSVADTPVTVTETTTLPNGTQTTTQRIISQTALPGFLFNNAPLGNNVGGNTSSIGTQGLSNFALGRINNDLGFGGLVLSASSEAVSALLRALSAHRNVQILSRPQILALDNQLAQIQVGQQVPIVTGFNTNATTGVANPLVTYDPAGIILTVTPRISPEGQIVMEVIAEKSAFTGAGVPIFTDATTGNVIESPIKDITTALTSVKVPDGQTIVVGGMITKSEDVLTSKVPYLGDIPLVGNLFRYDSRQHRRTELLIFLTPRIIRGDADVELIKQVEMERMHFFEDEAEMVHGPLMGVPSSRLAPLGADDAFPFAEPGMIVDPQLMIPEYVDPHLEPTPVTPRTPAPPAPGPRLETEPPPNPAPGVYLFNE